MLRRAPGSRARRAKRPAPGRDRALEKRAGPGHSRVGIGQVLGNQKLAGVGVHHRERLPDDERGFCFVDLLLDVADRVCGDASEDGDQHHQWQPDTRQYEKSSQFHAVVALCPLWTSAGPRLRGAEIIGHHARTRQPYLTTPECAFSGQESSIRCYAAPRQTFDRQQRTGENMVKRAFDVLASAAALVVLSPLLVVVGVLVRLKLRATPIFAQVRPWPAWTTFYPLQVPHDVQCARCARITPARCSASRRVRGDSCAVPASMKSRSCSTSFVAT